MSLHQVPNVLLPLMWNLQVHESCLFVKSGAELQLSREPILDIRESKETPDFIKVCIRLLQAVCTSVTGVCAQSLALKLLPTLQPLYLMLALYLFYVQAKFLLEKSPRLLPLKVFAWDANSVSRCFRNCKNGAVFCAVWKREVVPKLASDGTFADPSEVDTSEQSTLRHCPESALPHH